MDNDFSEQNEDSNTIVLQDEPPINISNEIPNQNEPSEKLDLLEAALSLKRYFNYKKGDVFAFCRLCSKKVSRKDQNTKSMTTHLQQHPLHFTNYSNAKKSLIKRPNTSNAIKNLPAKQLRMTDFKPVHFDKKTSDQADDKLLRFICLSCEPFSFSEKAGFSEYVSTLCPRLNSLIIYYLLQKIVFTVTN
jgi:hypothetical protein